MKTMMILWFSSARRGFRGDAVAKEVGAAAVVKFVVPLERGCVVQI